MRATDKTEHSSRLRRTRALLHPRVRGLSRRSATPRRAFGAKHNLVVSPEIRELN